MRRAVVVVVCVVLAGAFVTRVGVGHSAVQSTQASPETLVDHLLHTQAASLMTGAARRALEALGGQAASARVSEAERQRLAQLQPATGGVSSAAVSPALVANVRVSEPAQDSAQIDQTTQSETSVAVAGSNVAVGFNDSQQG